MANLVIVAIPEESDYVWKISSEKVPHLTLLFLGDPLNARVERIRDFLEHAIETSLTCFSMDVERRGTLGEDRADVVFFRTNYWSRDIVSFRASLLKNEAIKAAYDSVEQFDQWTPHLTLGYPETPARPDNRDYPGIHHVRFDRIALWYGDSEGPTFELRSWDAFAEEVTMSDLEHHGVKGMRWGVRRRNIGTGSEVVVRTTPSRFSSKTKITVSGGKGLRPSDDAVKAAVARQKAKQSGVDSLSNDELKTLVSRMNLEQQLSGLSSKQRSHSTRVVKDFLNSPEGRLTVSALKATAKNRRVRRAFATAATAAVVARS